MSEHAFQHGTCISFGDAGVLLLGPPGSGKSDLALRLIDQSGSGISGVMKRSQLVADDQVIVRRQKERLVASAPPSIAGLIEIRGLGPVSLPYLREIELALAVRLAANPTIERLPELENNRWVILGVSLPMIEIDAASASAPARIRAALDRMAGQESRLQGGDDRGIVRVL